MTDNVLSQNQIDALLAQAMGTASTDGPSQERFLSVRSYDFRHPSKLSKEQLRTLQMIFENFARQASVAMSTFLRSQVQIALVSIQQAVFDEYERGLPATTCVGLATAEPLPGTFAYEIDLGTSMAMMDRLLGGAGDAREDEPEVTDIEATLLHSIFSGFLAPFSEAWSHLVPVAARLQRLEYSLRYVQLAPSNDPVVLLLYDLRAFERQTTLSMCIPYSMIEPVVPELNVQTLFAVSQRDDSDGRDSEEAQQRLQRVHVSMVAQLGSTILALGEVNDLQVGDIVRLDGLASDPIIVSVNQRPTFMARPGTGRQGIAVQILGILPDEVTA